MPGQLFLVAYDGEDGGVVSYAADHAKTMGASLHVLHVLEWSPYSFLTPEELAERHKRRTEELARANDIVMAPILKSLNGTGVEVSSDIRYGNVVDLIIGTAKDKEADMIFVGRSGNSLADRVFGSVPIGLAQAAPVATVIVP
ncbi:MAG: universal stress protein [Pseudomonadota bacterium]